MPAAEQPVTRKGFSRVELKADQPGAFKAYIATLNVVDKDGDVSLPGSFPDGKRILISAYQHTSWYGVLPVGDGVVASDGKEAWVDGKFWMDTDLGKQTYLAVKNAGDLQEWSYGYDVKRGSTDAADLEQFPGSYRVLKEQDVYEASPVLVGAGVNTRTDAIKSAKGMVVGERTAGAKALATQLKAATLDPETMAVVAQVDLLADQLDELVDTLMDQLGIPDPDEVAEGELEEPKSLSFVDHSQHALAGVRGFVARAKALADLRAKKQHKDAPVVSAVNRERLAALAGGLSDSLADVKSLLDASGADVAPAAADEELSAIWLEHQRRQADLVGQL